MNTVDHFERLPLARQRGDWRAPLGIAVGTTLLAALLGSWGSADAAEQYLRLSRPSWAPPSSVFGPVWTVLYAAMAYGAFRAFTREPARRRRIPLYRDYSLLLLLNAAWTWLFFRFGLGIVAALDSAAMLVLLAGLFARFARRDLPAGLLLLPAILWTAFATALTVAITWLNPALR